MNDSGHVPTHRRDVEGGIGVWEVARLWKLAAELPVSRVSLASLEAEYDKVYWFGGNHLPTVRAVVEHARKIAAADLTNPVILSQTGVIMDGVHRLARAFMLGHHEIEVVQFSEDPEPDRIEPTPQQCDNARATPSV
jgi:hypothetical protein